MVGPKRGSLQRCPRYRSVIRPTIELVDDIQESAHDDVNTVFNKWEVSLWVALFFDSRHPECAELLHTNPKCTLRNFDEKTFVD